MQKVLFYTFKVLIKQYYQVLLNQFKVLDLHEPYKGKGVLFNNEIIRRKEGKKK